jgi:hypothetical protein
VGRHPGPPAGKQHVRRQSSGVEHRTEGGAGVDGREALADGKVEAERSARGGARAVPGGEGDELGGAGGGTLGVEESGEGEGGAAARVRGKVPVVVEVERPAAGAGVAIGEVLRWRACACARSRDRRSRGIEAWDMGLARARCLSARKIWLC